MRILSVTLTFCIFFLKTSCIGQSASDKLPLQRIECSELGIFFMLPSGFKYINNNDFEKLSKRGDKAIKEEFGSNEQLGWQSPCNNFQDSLKRTILISMISEKEAIQQNGSIDAFIKKSFADQNEFMIRRIETRMNETLDSAKAFGRREITISGYPVITNDFTWIKNGILLIMTRSYFFQRKGKLFLVVFQGSGKATDNELVQAGLENGKRVSE